LRLGRAARKQLAESIARATSLQGDFFRSVAFRYFHPDDVISGEGTRLHGGRFVPVGVRTVYASLEEETALREVTTRKSTLRPKPDQCRGLSTDDLYPLCGDESKS
jgi:RES domain-containing protein